MPAHQVVARIHGAVERLVPEGSVGVSLEELLALRTAAAVRVRDLVTDARPQMPKENTSSTGAGPAQDRRSDDQQVLLTLESLVDHYRAGRRRDVLSLISAASQALIPAQVAALAAELRFRGEDGLIEALLLSGRQHGPDQVTEMALALLDAGLATEAAMMMRASLPASRPSPQ